MTRIFAKIALIALAAAVPVTASAQAALEGHWRNPKGSVIVKVAVPARSARICRVTLRLPPAATVATDCVDACGLCSRSALLGVKLTSTDKPPAAAAALLVTVAVALKVWPRRMLGIVRSSMASRSGSSAAAP